MRRGDGPAAVLAVVLAVLAVAGAQAAMEHAGRPAAGPATEGPVAAAISPVVTVQQFSTAGILQDARLTLWHNSTSSNQSVAHSYPVDLGAYSGAASPSFTLTVSFGSDTPVMRVAQGATTFLNGSLLYQLAVSPALGATAVTAKVLKGYLPNGTALPVGTYTVWANATQSIAFTEAVGELWTLAGTTDSLYYNYTAPSGYWVNGTQVYLPFPSGVGVNYTGVTVTGGTSVSVGYSGIYVTNATLAPGATLRLRAQFYPTPVTTGAGVSVQLSKAQVVSNLYGATNVWISFGNYTNLAALPYAGLYLLRTNFAYTVDPSSVVVRVNGVLLSSSGYNLQGGTIVILPNVLTVGIDAKAEFAVNFSSTVAPPEASLVGGYVLATFGVTPFTVTDLIVTGMAAVVVWWLARLYGRGRWGGTVRTLTVDFVALEAALTAALLVVTYAPLSPG